MTGLKRCVDWEEWPLLSDANFRVLLLGQFAVDFPTVLNCQLKIKARVNWENCCAEVGSGVQ